MGQKVNLGSWLRLSGNMPLQQASKHQMAEISMMNAAGLFIIARGSLSQCNYHSANVCSSHRSKGKGTDFQPWTSPSCCKMFAVIFVFNLTCVVWLVRGWGNFCIMQPLELVQFKMFVTFPGTLTSLPVSRMLERYPALLRMRRIMN